MTHMSKQQQFVSQMYSPSKIKTNKDMIKKSIINNQLLDGAWVI